MFLLNKLKEQHLASSMHPNKGAALFFAIEKLSKICGPYFKIYGIDCTLDLSFGYDGKADDNFGKLYIFPTPEKVTLNKSWNLTHSDWCRDDMIHEIRTFCEMLRKSNSHREIKITESAEIILNEFDSRCITNMLNSNDDLLSRQWGRAHIHALKLCGIYSISDGFYSPLITESMALKCVSIVEQSIKNLWLHLKNSGKTKRSTDEEQRSQLFAILRKKLKSGNIVTRSYIQRRLSNCAPFRNDIAGPREAIYKCIGYLCAEGVLNRVLEDSPRAAVKYKVNDKFFQ